MTRTIFGLVVFAGGVAVGLLIAKEYARYQVQGGIDSALSRVGLGGGAVQGVADSLVPVLVG